MNKTLKLLISIYSCLLIYYYTKISLGTVFKAIWYGFKTVPNDSVPKNKMFFGTVLKPYQKMIIWCGSLYNRSKLSSIKKSAYFFFSGTVF